MTETSRAGKPESVESDAGSLAVRPITMRIGAEILGIDLARPLTAAQREGIHDALMRHQVVFFRDQYLDHDQLKAFGRAFGSLDEPVRGALPDHPEILTVHADASSTYVYGGFWHSDLSCKAEPPMGSILYLPVVPEVGGDTVFASMYAAYGALSPRMRAYLEGMTAVHDGERFFRPYFTGDDQRFPVTAHPVVRTHPVTGRKALYVNPAFTSHILGVGRAESEAILGYLHQHCTNPNFQMRFKWRPHSVAFWDNRCAQHFAVWDYYPETRSGFRVQVAGDKPY
jgi:taurine dioxygenase